MRTIAHACRLQFTAIVQFDVRHLKDWEATMEEFTASNPQKSLQAMYILVTSDPIWFSHHELEGLHFLPQLLKSQARHNNDNKPIWPPHTEMAAAIPLGKILIEKDRKRKAKEAGIGVFLSMETH